MGAIATVREDIATVKANDPAAQSSFVIFLSYPGLHHGVYLPVESVAVVQGVTCPSFHTRRIDIVRQQFNQFTLWEYPPDEIPVHRQTVPICR